MEAQAQRATPHPFAWPKQLHRTNAMDPKQKFYRHFQDSIAVLRDQIIELETVAIVGGERQEATDHVLAGISKLQNEVSDAAEYTPSYDRRQYADAIKSLQDQLNSTVARITPRSRFQFRRSSITRHIDMGAAENDPRFNPGSLSRNSIGSRPSIDSTRLEDDENEGEDQVSPLLSETKDYNKEMAKPMSTSLRKPSFSAAKQIGISGQTGLHIILPMSAARATASGSLTDLSGCIVDMSIPTSKNEGAPFPGLALKNIKDSLIIAGRVSGPVHITGITNSVLVVIARQVRIHECQNVDVYLHCGSHPIIEDCKGMRFAPLPSYYKSESEESSHNQWDQVDDFKWLKSGHSPNWTTIPDAERLTHEVWTKVVRGQPGSSVGETLQKVGLPSCT